MEFECSPHFSHAVLTQWNHTTAAGSTVGGTLYFSVFCGTVISERQRPSVPLYDSRERRCRDEYYNNNNNTLYLSGAFLSTEGRRIVKYQG